MDAELVHQLFQDQSAAQILDIYIPNAKEAIEDKLIWKHHPNGTFSWKSFIKTLKDNQVPQPAPMIISLEMFLEC